MLKVERVGVFDNFFELGGHSLLATQIASRVQKALQRNVPLRAMFECTTVEELASYIESLAPSEISEQKAERLNDLMSKLERRAPPQADTCAGAWRARRRRPGVLGGPSNSF